ncbi:hypothetical protein Y1Q_0018348 [Alligator mississippiensis]|uniref:Uncharacterized protein n=1 Tax=Alligator mississippiensis TaxID=8496 RepID=A0A151PBT0_ALLMI|nr:hypothetical protein Y1Q_0018348 [Alligator mississippiensis]
MDASEKTNEKVLKRECHLQTEADSLAWPRLLCYQVVFRSCLRQPLAVEGDCWWLMCLLPTPEEDCWKCQKRIVANLKHPKRQPPSPCSSPGGLQSEAYLI